MPINLLRVLAIPCALLAATPCFAQGQLLAPTVEPPVLTVVVDQGQSVFENSNCQPPTRMYPRADFLFSWMTVAPIPTPEATSKTDANAASTVFPFAVVRQTEFEPPLLPSTASFKQPPSSLIVPAESEQGLPICMCDEPLFSDSLVQFFREGIWYFSWGYSRESWARTNIHVSQPSQNSNFTVHNVRADDDPSFGGPLTAQYNFRLGRFIDEARTLAIEINFDHTKYTSVVGQTALVTGTIAGKPVNANYQLNDAFFNYDLHNGANHVMFNVAKFVPLIGELHDSCSVAAVGKIGIGPMLPHAENQIMGENVDVGPRTFNNLIGLHSGWWQLNGWTTGIEAGFRVNLTKAIYLELTDKVAFAQLYDVPVYQGTARQNLWMNEVILSLGFTFGGR